MSVLICLQMVNSNQNLKTNIYHLTCPKQQLQNIRFPFLKPVRGEGQRLRGGTTVSNKDISCMYMFRYNLLVGWGLWVQGKNMDGQKFCFTFYQNDRKMFKNGLKKDKSHFFPTKSNSVVQGKNMFYFIIYQIFFPTLGS